MGETMRAVRMHGPGPVEVLRLERVARPAPSGEREVLVRVMAAGVNPVDAKLRARGTYYPDRLPCILGCDGAGVVEATGPGVTRFGPGDAVYYCYGGIGGHPGSYAEYAVIDERYAVAKPAALDFIEAAAAPLVLITAWESLHDRARIAPGQRVLVHAGAGGVGHVAIQLARLAGARVATTVSDAAKAALVSELGAEEAIRYRDRDFVEAALDWSDGEGVDIALDTVGGETFNRSLATVRHYGDLVTLLQPPADTDWGTARERNLRIGLELMLTPMYAGLESALAHQAEILERCARLCDAGELRIHVQRVLPLADAAEAQRLIETGSPTGKLVLQVQA